MGRKKRKIPTRKSRCSIERRSTSPLRNFCNNDELAFVPIALLFPASTLIIRD